MELHGPRPRVPRRFPVWTNNSPKKDGKRCHRGEGRRATHDEQTELFARRFGTRLSQANAQNRRDFGVGDDVL